MKVGAVVDIHKAIGRFPKPKVVGLLVVISIKALITQWINKGGQWTSLVHQWIISMPILLQIMRMSTRHLRITVDKADMHHDIVFGIAGNSKKKHSTDRKMVEENIP